MFIDGGNFHHLVLKKLRIADVDFDFSLFAEFLANGRSLERKIFYTGTVREREGDERSRAAMSRQTRFLTQLSKTGWTLELSKLRRRTESVPIDDRVENYQALRKVGIKEIRYVRDREKGVDVKIAADLIMGAIEDRYDTAILVSSDADLLPAISCVRGHFKKKIEYVGFSILDERMPENSTRPLLSMISKTDRQRSLIESDVRVFARDQKELGV